MINRLEESVAELRSLREQLLVDITQIKTDIEKEYLKDPNVIGGSFSMTYIRGNETVISKVVLPIEVNST